MPALVDDNDLLAAVQYPDPTTGLASSSQQETYAYNALGVTFPHESYQHLFE